MVSVCAAKRLNLSGPPLTSERAWWLLNKVKREELESIKWLPKSPKLHGSHNWNSQGSRWASLKGKETTHGGNLYKFSSSNEKWKEGRISPEQEAEELEDPDEDEPRSKFSGSLFDTRDTIRDQRNARVTFPDGQKGAAKVKPFPALSNKHSGPAAAPKDGNRRFSKETKEQVPRTAGASEPPSKDVRRSEPSTPDSGSLPSSKSGSFQTANHVMTIPRIILTRPSTSDEDADQLTQDHDDSEPEETDYTESHFYSDCLNHAFYPP